MNAVGKEAMEILNAARTKLDYEKSDAVLIEDVSRNFGHVIAKFAEENDLISSLWDPQVWVLKKPHVCFWAV